jgi:hypothetical protein
MSATTDNRPTTTYAGDARDTVGQIKGPIHGELLVVDEAVYDADANRTRVWFRSATPEEIEEISNDPGLMTALVDLGTPAWDLPSRLVGAVGYVDIACDGCGTLTRQHGISDPSKGWALCPECLAKPDAHAKIEAKRRQNRAAAAAQGRGQQ